MKNKKTLFIILAVVIVLVFVIYLMFSNKNSDLKFSCTYVEDSKTSIRIDVSEKDEKLIYNVIESYDVSDLTDEQKQLYQKLVEFNLLKYDDVKGLEYNVKIEDNKLVCSMKFDLSVMEATDFVSMALPYEETSESMEAYEELSTMDISTLKSMLESGGFKCKEY